MDGREIVLSMSVKKREGERKGGRIDRRRCLTSFSGEAKKDGRREREKERERETDETFSDANEDRMVEKADERRRGGMDGWGVGEGGERNNKSVIDRGRAARRE